MIGTPNTQGQKYCVGVVQWAPETSVSEEIADVLHNYDIDVIVNKEFLVTSEVICQWKSLQIISRVTKKCIIPGNECIILFLSHCPEQQFR